MVEQRAQRNATHRPELQGTVPEARAAAVARDCFGQLQADFHREAALLLSCRSSSSSSSSEE